MNPIMNNKKTNSRLIGSFITPKSIIPKGSGRIKNSTIIRKMIPETNKIIINAIIPRIRGNLYNRNEVGTPNMRMIRKIVNIL